MYRNYFYRFDAYPVCENKREYSNRVFKGYAHKAKSTMGWYYGFKLHLLCNERGELLNFALTKAYVDDCNPEVFNNLTKDLFGKLYAAKGYISQSLFGVSPKTQLQVYTIKHIIS